MRRTKIKTDNVEQLMEIVRSLQRGEEPTQESIRKEAERVSETDAPLSDTSGHDTGSRTSKEKAQRTMRLSNLWKRPTPASVRDGSGLRTRKSRRAAEDFPASGRRLPDIWKAGGRSGSLKTTITKTPTKRQLFQMGKKRRRQRRIRSRKQKLTIWKCRWIQKGNPKVFSSRWQQA